MCPTWRPIEELRALQERERAPEATPAQRRSWFRRKAELFELLAAARPDDPAYADAAANARHQLVVLDADRESPE